jgi:hypothetical protein
LERLKSDLIESRRALLSGCRKAKATCQRRENRDILDMKQSRINGTRSPKIRCFSRFSLCVDKNSTRQSL